MANASGSIKTKGKGLVPLILYLSPFILAISVTLFFNYDRSMKVVDEIYKDLKKPVVDKSGKNEENDWLQKRYNNFIKKKRAEAKPKYTIEEIKRVVIYDSWRWDSIIIIVMALLPFVFLGSRLAFSREVREKIGKDSGEKEIYKKMLSIARRDWVMKYIVGFIVCAGLLYVFNPFGIAGSTAYKFLKIEDPISANTAPIFFEFGKSSFNHVLAGFWGWYLYLLWYLFHKFFKKDVISTRVYLVLFKKFLFVIGIALILSAFGKESTLIVSFLIGFFPLSALSLLKEFGQIKFSSGEDAMVPLSKLPGISRWEILRLEEEGIESTLSLATTDPGKLKEEIPINEKAIDLWIDAALLMNIVGSKKYETLKESLMIEYFVDLSKKKKYKKLLTKEKSDKSTPDEIAKLIKEIREKSSTK